MFNQNYDPQNLVTTIFSSFMILLFIYVYETITDTFHQCFGSGSGRIRIIWPDPDPYQGTLIWIQVPKKIVINSHTNQPKL